MDQTTPHWWKKRIKKFETELKRVKIRSKRRRKRVNLLKDQLLDKDEELIALRKANYNLKQQLIYFPRQSTRISANESDDLNDSNSSSKGSQRSTRSLGTQTANAIQIVPSPTKSAKQLKDVYDLQKIITGAEADAIRTMDLKWAASRIKFDFIRELVATKSDETSRLIAVYISISLLVLTKLSTKATLPVTGFLEDYNDIVVKPIVHKYSSICFKSGSRKVGDAYRRKLICHTLILIFMLSDYKPIKLSQLHAMFDAHVKKLVNCAKLIGCDEITINNEKFLKMHFPAN